MHDRHYKIISHKVTFLFQIKWQYLLHKIFIRKCDQNIRAFLHPSSQVQGQNKEQQVEKIIFFNRDIQG